MSRRNLLHVCYVCRNLHLSSSVLGQSKHVSKSPYTLPQKSLLLSEHKCLVKKARGKQLVCLLNHDTTDNIAKIVCKKQTNKSSVILEINSGPGILTKALLDNTDQHIISTNPVQDFLSYLQNLASNYPKQLTVSDWNPFASLYKNLSNNAVSKFFEQEQEVLSQIPHKEWTEDPPLTVVGSVLPDQWYQVLHYLMKNMASREGLYTGGRVEWFLFIPSRGFRWFWNAEKYPSISSYYSVPGIMLNLLFNIKHHLTLPAEEFSPVYPGEKFLSEKTVKAMMVNKNDAHLMQFTPKSDLEVRGEDIIRFRVFLQQLLYGSKNQRLIPRMEEWLPGIGIPLINKGFPMMQKMRDLQPDQLLQIYKEIVKLPEFENSALHELLEESISHLRLTVDDDHLHLTADEEHLHLTTDDDHLYLTADDEHHHVIVDNELVDGVKQFDNMHEDIDSDLDPNIFNIDSAEKYLKYEQEEEEGLDSIDYHDTESDEPGKKKR